MTKKSVITIPGLASLLILGSASSVLGVTLTWDGSSNATWSRKQNWVNNNSITAGDDLVFAGGSNTTTNNDTTAGTGYNSITFDSTASAFILNGSSVTLGAGVSGSSITSNSTSLQTINLDLILSGNRTITTAAGSITINGVISGATFGITKLGAQTLTLSGVNTYTGLTTVSAGTLAYGVTNAISTGAVTVDGSTAVLSLGAFNDSVGTVTVANGGSITGTGTLTSTGTFEMQSGSVSAILGGTGIALNKTTSGTVTLSGANTYTGITSITAGTLVVNGNQSGATGAVSVGSVAKLFGTGTIGGATTILGTQSSGASSGAVGTQTFSSSLTYSSGSIFEWDINVTGGVDTHDHVVANSLSGSGAIFKIVGSGDGYAAAFWNSNHNWSASDLFGITNVNLASIFSGANTTFNANPTEGSFSFTSIGSGTNNSLTWTAVPEPTSALAGVLLGAGLLRRKRNQRQSA